MPQLIRLSIENNQLTNLNFGNKASIDNLNCNNNQLTNLNYRNGFSISELSYANNNMPNLDLSRLNTSSLTSLTCSGNQITSLNITSFSNLSKINCSNNQITSINLAPLTRLQTIDCSNNLLSNLTVSGFPSLTSLSCGSNPFTAFNLNTISAPLQLTTLMCNNLGLQTLNVSPYTNLTTLDFKENPLANASVIGFPGLTKLTFLDCSSTLFSTLDVTHMRSLTTLYCNNDEQLTTINAKNGRSENIEFANCPNLRYICADENQLINAQNRIIQYAYTNCHVNSYCSFTLGGLFYTINGNNKYDSNTNGCDVADRPIPNLKVKFVNASSTANLITNTVGNYTYSVQTGTNVITPSLEMPGYFNISPASYSIAFPAQTSPANANFCITPNGVHNDLEVVILPIGAARPGFDVLYRLIYKNKGTAAQSGTVNLVFDDAIMDFVSANPDVTSQTVNNLSWSFSNLLPFETRTILLKLNLNSPTETPAVNDGDIFPYTATISGLTDETPNDNVSGLYQRTVNSFDPNDKTCVEGAVIPPAKVGDYVHYVIRFENTGTANAVNVIVRDVIDTTKYDIATLAPLYGSNPFVTKINNTNKAEFVFENINLPFDDANNDGYVAFKIKTKASLGVGNSFSNSAYIHFDYNFPIVTNTAITTIRNPLSNQDFEFNDVFSLSPVPTKDTLAITAKQDVLMSSASIYNMLGQLVQVITSPSETIDVSVLQPGNYFIRIISNKGSATGRFIKE